MRTRAEPAAWVTSPKNPYFARGAFVNRMWGHWARLRRSRRRSLRAVERTGSRRNARRAGERLRVERASDVRRLIRTITQSEVYGLSSGPAARVDADNVYWARFRLVPLAPDVLICSLFVATNLDEAARRAGRSENLEQVKAQLFKQ